MAEGQGEKKVMVAIDESQCSLYALEWTLENLYDTIKSSKPVIFTAQPISDLGYLYGSTLGATPPELVRSVQENRRKLAAALLENARNICTKYRVTPETATEEGDPKEVICEAVEKLNIQLLVLGSHSRGPLQRAFLGSVSNYCVHHAKCPVLVVKKTAKESA